MKRVPVESSNVRAIGYDEPTQTLEVEFKSGDVYTYTDVPPQMHAALLAAPSIGSYLHHYVKPNRRYGKVPDETSL